MLKPEIVDAMANVQKSYDYYYNVFGRKGVHDSADGQLAIWFDVPGHEGNAGMTESGNYIYIGSPKNENDIIQSAYIESMGHEFTHGVIFNDTSLQLGNYYNTEAAMHEGIADIFGELIEAYYSPDGKCDWIHGNDRNMINPANDNISAASAYNSSVEGHDASTLVSHPAYLMTQGINGTQALTTDELGALYYQTLPKFNGEFKDYRKQIESTALAMNQNMNQIGPLTMIQSEQVKKDGQLTDAQWESVVDAFDRVGIERDYDHSLLSDAEITVIDRYYEPYDNYHLKITRKNDGSVVVDEDVKKKKYTLPNLAKGVYEFELTDLETDQESVKVSVIINDNASGQLTDDYKDADNIFTSFGSPLKEVALALDVSGSMDGTPLQQTKQAALNFVNTVFDANPNIHVTLITYSGDAHVLLESCNDRSVLCSAIIGLRSGGGTAMAEALSSANRILAEKQVMDKYLIVMSDGNPSDAPTSIAADIRENNITLCSLGFYHSDDSGARLMQSIASLGYYYNVRNSSDVQGVFDEIARQVSGEEYTLREFHCPIDIIVTYNGETLCSAKENQNLRTSFGSISFGGEDGETKILRLDNKADYEICVYGTGVGTMDYVVSYVDENGDYTDVRSFEDIPIQDETIISTRNVKTAQTLLEVDTNGDGRFDLQYTGRAGEQGEASANRPWLLAVMLPGIILAAWLLLEIVLLIRRDRMNRTCAGCGAAVLKREAKFCAACGGAVNTIPVLPKWTKPTGKRKVILGLQTTLAAVCVVLTLGTTLVYYSAANTVYMQMRNAELASATLLYQSGVQEKALPCRYLSAVTNVYLDRVEREQQAAKISDATATAIYQTVTEMEMGTASDAARGKLESLSQSIYE